MSNPLQPIIDGLLAATTHWQAVLGVLLILGISQFILYSLLRRVFGNKLTGDEYFSLSLAGWLLPALLLSLFWYGLAWLLSPQTGIHVVIISVVGFVLFFRAPKENIPSSKRVIASLMALAILFIILRLAFASKAVLPMYFDSAQHYLFTKNLLASLAPEVPWSLANYYHLGYHFIAAFITTLTRAPINDVMLVLGQVILGTMPFASFFIVKQWTRSYPAAIFALLLASFGWYMPAHAVDWGKYPALASLSLLPFALSMVYLTNQNINLPTKKFLGLSALVSVGMCITIFLHSRALIVFGIAALAWIVTSLWERLPGIARHIMLGIMTLALFAEIAFIQPQGILSPLFDPYGSKALWVSLAVLFLSFFAYLGYPRLVFFCIVSIVLLLISLFIQLGDLIPGFARMTLLDRPFVEMILYLPLTLLGGFGLAALEQRLRSRNITYKNAEYTWGKWIGVFFILLVIVNAWFKYDLYPADCCDIASHDDLAAIQWMNVNLPMDARILVSSTDLKVLPTEEYQGSAGGDAGTWINPLTGRTTVFMPFITDFSQQQTLDMICQQQVNYVYVGKTGSTFDDSGMPVQPNAYKVLFALPNARIYEVTGCP